MSKENKQEKSEYYEILAEWRDPNTGDEYRRVKIKATPVGHEYKAHFYEVEYKKIERGGWHKVSEKDLGPAE